MWRRDVDAGVHLDPTLMYVFVDGYVCGYACVLCF